MPMVPAPRQRLRDPPQEVVVPLLGARRLERVHVAALRIDAGHDVLDDAVLAGRIHALKHDEHGPTTVGVKALLQLLKPRDRIRENRLHVVHVGRKTEAFGRIMIGEPEMLRLVDPAVLDDLGKFHLGLLLMRRHHCRHIASRNATTKARHPPIEIGAAAHDADIGELRLLSRRPDGA